MICNYISALPRCQQEEESFTALRAARSQLTQPGLVARQTQQKLELEVGELGYLSSTLVTQSSSSRVTGSAALLIILTVMVTRCQ